MTVLFFLLFSCLQAFSAAPARPSPLSRPSFVTNLLPPTCFRLVSILCRILASVPPYFIFCHILTSAPSYFIFCHILTSVLPYSIFCCIPASVLPYSRLLFATFSAFIILSVYIFLRDHSVRISYIHQKYLFHHQMLL